MPNNINDTSSIESLGFCLKVNDAPWAPMGEGQWFRLLKILPNWEGYILQLKLMPGTVIPLHRHTGPVYALNIVGSRRLNTGEVIDVGDFVFEPTGNEDSWEAVGNTPLIVHVNVSGSVEYLDENKNVQYAVDAKTIKEAYTDFCKTQGIPIVQVW